MDTFYKYIKTAYKTYSTTKVALMNTHEGDVSKKNMIESL